MPSQLVAEFGLREGVTFGDIDELIWSSLSDEAIDGLLNALGMTITFGRHRLAEANEILFETPVPLELLGLSARIRNLLIRHGVVQRQIVSSLLLAELGAARGWGGVSILQVVAASSEASRSHLASPDRPRALLDEMLALPQPARSNGSAIPSAVAAMPIEGLDLPQRAFNSLKRHGITNVGQLLQTPDEELLRMRNLGKKSLDQIKERLAAPRHIEAPGQSRSRAVRKEAARLAKRRWARQVYRDDPRLAAELRALVPGAIDAMSAAELLPAMSFEPAGARRKADQIRRFVAHGDELARRSLEDELDDFLQSATRNVRAQRALRRRLGWDGRQPSTLDVAAREMEVTKERVRQIESKFRKAMQRNHTWTPALDKTLKLLNRLTLRAADEVQRELRDARLISTTFSVASIVGAAEVFGRDAPPVEEHQGVLVAAGFAKTAGEVQLRGRRLADRSGATTVAELAGVLAEHSTAVTETGVRVSLDMLAGLRWLDDEHNWFYVRGSRRNRVLNAVEKILSVAGSIALSELRDGVGRVDRTRPPRAVLARLCEDTGLYRIESDRVVGTEQLPDWRSVLAPNERELADVLFEHGPVMRRSELERIAVEERGMNRNSFYIYLTYSPVLQRYAPGVFGLRGAPVTAAQVNELIPPIVHSQVLRDHGWTTDGRIWIAYRLSQAAAASGVLAAPAALAPLLRGEFQLATRSREQIGTLVVEESRVWGLSPFYRRRGVEAGDYLLLTFNTKDRSAVVETGDDSLLLRYQAGE